MPGKAHKREISFFCEGCIGSFEMKRVTWVRSVGHGGVELVFGPDDECLVSCYQNVFICTCMLMFRMHVGVSLHIHFGFFVCGCCDVGA
jgi:hypothetical protein